MKKNTLSFALLLVAAGSFTACKKNIPDVMATPLVETPVVVVPTGDKVKDSSLYFARDLYLWSSQLPDSMNAQSYADPAALMKAIRPYSTEPGFGAPVDKWSFAMKKVDWDRQAGGMSLLADLASDAGDFGLTVFFKAEGDLRVRLVEPNSPAGRAGIKRGWRITEINGSTNMTIGNAGYIINNVYEASSASFTFVKPGNASEAITLQAAHYTEKPVYMDTVYQLGGKRIGYLVYNSFLGDRTQVASQLQAVFSRLASSQVTDLIVDLRYNGGGYVSLAEMLVNYIAPSSAQGGLMMNQVFNTKHSTSNNSTYIQKAGGINLSSVHFIVSKSTASASELLINTLKPYMDVKLIGPTATHGKPVGFFPQPVGDWYVFPVSFKTTNKNGEGSYFNGLAVDAVVADGLDKDWGDPDENCLAAALKKISTGSYRQAQAEAPSPAALAGNAQLDKPFLKITIGKQ